MVKWLSARNKLYLSSPVWIHPKPPSFIIDNTDIDFPNPHLPTSLPIAPVLNIGMSAGTEMTVACEIPLKLFAIKLTFTFINSNLTGNQVEGPEEGAINILQHPFTILTGSCFLQICIFYT